MHTCVSAASGNDANSCHCTTPCRTFQRAHAQTLSDGQITVLDAGGYGPVTITKSISIVNDGGGAASIIVSGNATGVEISSGNAIYVNLRGLTIQGVGFGTTTGVRFDNGFTLTMTNCVVRNHIGNGIEFKPNGSSNLAVSNTLVADNGGSGIFVQPRGDSNNVKVQFNRVEAYNNSVHGFAVEGQLATNTTSITAMALDSVAVANNGTGFRAFSSSGGAVIITVLTRFSAAANGTGISALPTDRVALGISQSTLLRNDVTWPGKVESYGDNVVLFNGDNDPAALFNISGSKK